MNTSASFILMGLLIIVSICLVGKVIEHGLIDVWNEGSWYLLLVGYGVIAAFLEEEDSS